MKMTLFYLDEMYPYLDVKDILAYPNIYGMNCIINVPKFDYDPSLSIDHVVIFLKCTSEINMVHEDAIMRLFIDSLKENQRK